MRKLILLPVFALCLQGCDKSTDNYCTRFSTKRGDFEECHWLIQQADELCRSKGYNSGAFGEVKDTVGCSGTSDRYISEVTCCK